MSRYSEGNEPRFDIDLQYGKQGEMQVGELLDWITEPDGKMEVKRKRILDHRVYVETHCDKGRRGIYKPSGISVTTACVWSFVVADTGIVLTIPTNFLREMLNDPSSKDKEERDGNCPTRGKLVDICVLLFREKQRRARLAKASGEH